MPEPRTRITLILQMEYNSKRAGGPDQWEWLDSPMTLGGGKPEEQIAQAKAYIKRSGTSRFIRAYRIVERTTVTTDVVQEGSLDG